MLGRWIDVEDGIMKQQFKHGGEMMKAILISQEKLHKIAGDVINEYISNMKKAADDAGKSYDGLMEFADRLTLTVAMGLLETKLFNKGGEGDE